MGYERGSIFVYDKKLWLFEGYSTDSQMRQTLKLRGVGGEQLVALESDCFYLLSPNEIDYDAIERQQL
jgi:hypothetical protein